MDTVLKNLVGTDCFVFIDDIILLPSCAEEHARRLERVLQRFDMANLQFHPGKCMFAQLQVQYLGFVLSEKGVAAFPVKVKAVQNFPTPACVHTHTYIHMYVHRHTYINTYTYINLDFHLCVYNYGLMSSL